MEFSLQNEKSKILILILTLIVATILTYYFHFMLNDATIFTHFFYIPIILATLWWQRKGMIIPIILAIILLSSDFISGVNALTSDLFRAMMFLIIGAVVTILSEIIASDEQKIRESEEKFRSVAYSAADGILTADNQGKITYINDSFQEIFKYQPQELIGKEVTILLTENDQKNIRDILENYPRTGDHRLMNRTLESTGIRKDGTEFPLETSIASWKSDGETYFTGIVRDVTERKKMEEKKNELAAIVESSDDAIIGKTLEGTITSWNEGAEHIYGYKEEEILGKSIYQLIPPDHQDDFPILMEKISKGKHVKHYETQRVRKDGEIIDISLTLSPTKNIDGEIKGASSIARDITEKKRTEETLKERENYQQTIFSAIQTGIIVVDVETRKIVDLNDIAAELIGTSKDEIIGKTCHQFICPAEEDQCPILNLNQEVDNSERILINIHGEEIPIIKNVVKITLNGREHLLESFVDITERLKAEEQIKQSLKDKDMLIGEIHHRVKNNLLIITSLLSLQSSYVDDQKSRSLFEESENRTRSMALIHEKLYQSGEAKRIDFEEYIQSLGNELYNTYALNTNLIKLEMDLEKNLILDVDTAIPLGLIFNELFTNSLKHAFPDNRAGTIKVTFHKTGENYVLIVEDDGVGLPEDFKVEESDSFGLRLVDALTQQIDAQEDVDSTQGTSFTITFQEKPV
ncbi:MAG: PAS domain S-box protein [Methanobacterium sp.]|nr:PAS domain S-box protein [Methanobacterium sp.]